MRPYIVVCDGLDASVFQMLNDHNSFDVHPKSKLSPDEVVDAVTQAHALVVRSATKVNQSLIDNGKNLRYVIRAGTGTDNIDISYCKERGIKVSNTPGANNNSAAEHAIALMFTILRKTAWAHHSMSEGKWQKSLFSGLELSNKTVGILGFGQIGQIVAKRLSGFEPDILFYDPFIKESNIANAKPAESIEQLFEESDIVTLHTPLVEATKNLVTARLLSKMKKTAILINASRGGIVNEDDLLTCLQNNAIQGAAFDVFATEPLPDSSPLRNCSNLILTPHLGASTKEAQMRAGEMVFNQLKEFFDNDNLLNEVRV